MFELKKKKLAENTIPSINYRCVRMTVIEKAF